MKVEPGRLFIVATPIGNLDDISVRARDVLASVDFIAAEDTRHSRIMLSRLGINTKLVSYHDYNERKVAQSLIDKMMAGKSIALISDAGTPLINDPGYQLVAAAHTAGIKVIPVPGPSALIAALSVSGLTTDRFVFEGYLPPRPAARRKRLSELASETRTLVFFEAPHRIPEFIEDALSIFDANRMVTVARELTKIHETIHRDQLGRLPAWIKNEQTCLKGEFVVLIQGEQTVQRQDDSQRILEILLTEVSLRDAVNLTARITGRKRNEIYRQAVGKKYHGKEDPG